MKRQEGCKNENLSPKQKEVTNCHSYRESLTCVNELRSELAWNLQWNATGNGLACTSHDRETDSCRDTPNTSLRGNEEEEKSRKEKIVKM